MKYGCGWLPDKEHPLGTSGILSTKHLVGVSGPLPASVDLRQYVGEIHEQGSTNACIGMAIARAIALRAQIQRLSIPYPSELAIYTTARPMPLVDTGCYPRDAMAGLSQRGIVASSRWPFDESKVNVPLPWDEYQHGIDALATGYYRVDAIGAERTNEIRRALASGFPLAFGQKTDQAFEDYDGTGTIGRWVGPSLGRHGTCLIGYRPDGRGGFDFLGVNSWGPSWGMNGLYWISDVRIEDPWICDDFYAIEVAPALVT